MNTPTPGDLSARQVIADAIKLASSGQFGTAADVADWLRDELAALSALPAGGGVAPVLTAYRCDYCGRDYYDTATCCESRREYLAHFTTPPPDADVERNLPTERRIAAVEKLLAMGFKWDGKTWTDAAVGAQGDGFAQLIEAAEGAEAFLGVMFGSSSGRMPETVDTPLGIPVKLRAIASGLSAALNRAYSAVPVVGAQEEEAVESKLAMLIDLIVPGQDSGDILADADVAMRALSAAPAAGKGVDDDVREYLTEQLATEGAFEGLGYSKVERNLRALRKLDALTRQPVAGDGA